MASLYTFMQCINAYKIYRPGPAQVNKFLCQLKNIHLYVNIKNYRPGPTVGVRFMLLHKHAYKNMYTCLCKFPEAPSSGNSHIPI
jgi:hypothetical protein